MRTLKLALQQARFDNRLFWRNPAACFFTFVFPLMFLVIFNLVFSSNDIAVPGGKVSTSTFYVPGITALSVISACYTNIAMGLVIMRDSGILKRIRGTPLPTISFLMGRIIQAMSIAVLVVAIIMTLGVVLYSVDFDMGRAPALLLTLLVGAACFTSLGLAMSCFVPNEDAAPAVINASVLPLMFISNVFIPTSSAPDWLNTVAGFFPIAPFANAMHACFNPFGSGSGFEWGNLAVLAAWAVGGAVIASRFFAWEPRK